MRDLLEQYKDRHYKYWAKQENCYQNSVTLLSANSRLWKHEKHKLVMTQVCYINEFAVWKWPAARTRTPDNLAWPCPLPLRLVLIPSQRESVAERGSHCTPALFPSSSCSTLWQLSIDLWLLQTDTASRHHCTESVHAFVCFVLMWLIILSVLSVAFLKCNLTEQHERCVRPSRKQPPSHSTPRPT